MDSILLREINQQPEAVRQFLTQQNNNVIQIARQILERNVTHVIIAARGTSDNAARYAQYLFGANNHIPVALATPSLYTLYEKPPFIQDALVVGISQSGRSPDIVSVIETSRKQGQPTLAITNDPDSPLAQAAEWVIELHAGEERAVAATKTYTTSLAALALLSTALHDDPSRRDELNRVPLWMQSALSITTENLGRIERYTYISRSAVIGRGYNYSTAFETALKIKELTRIVTEPYSSADFLHGPISVLEAGFRFPLLVIAPSGKTKDDLERFIITVKERGADTVVVSDESKILSLANVPFRLPAGIPEWLSPIVAIIPGQLVALQLTLARGLNPDQPVGLKKVTETR
ncbi:MAG: SIS domain-containing protein [Anaerolineales bacterium]|jgi:glucosamine--fructose-6-phosphate aminotransferase (isomerizing)